MVTRAGGYYGEPFHGERGVTQGDPLLPTIFNVVVDAVLCHWESLMAEGSGRYNSSGKEAEHPKRWTIRAHNDGQRQTKEGLQLHEDIFYADAGIVNSTNPGCLKTVFDTLTRLFDRVGLKTNVWETVGVVCHPCLAARVRADKAYTRRMKEAGRSNKKRQRERVNCPECGKDLARDILDAH